jgi:hypothetical protein
MSLTSILGSKEHQDVRTKLKELFPKPRFELEGELLAPPRTKNYGGVGTAFDYLLRFYLEHKNPNANKSSWVAEISFALIENFVHNTNRNLYFEGEILEKTEFIDKVSIQLESARYNHKRFIESGILTNELIKSSILLAQLDVVFRANYFDPKFGIHNSEDIKDIKSLMQLINDDHFAVKENCYFNPTFGKGSMLVGGADADLILDDLLIDIKVTKHLKLSREYFNQIIGYYVLSLIGGVGKNKAPSPIKRIGIYFARHGKLWTISIDELANNKTFEEFKDWFLDYIEKYKRRKK